MVSLHLLIPSRSTSSPGWQGSEHDSVPPGAQGQLPEKLPETWYLTHQSRTSLIVSKLSTIKKKTSQPPLHIRRGASNCSIITDRELNFFYTNRNAIRCQVLSLVRVSHSLLLLMEVLRFPDWQATGRPLIKLAEKKHLASICHMVYTQWIFIIKQT